MLSYLFSDIVRVGDCHTGDLGLNPGGHKRFSPLELFYCCRKWVKSFLSSWKQRVLLDGKISDQADVFSGVPQGIVNGPLYFLAFINDLPECTSSETRLFADDGLLYKLIKSDKDAQSLQKRS